MQYFWMIIFEVLNRFLLVACSRDNGGAPCTNYESVPNGYICKIMYTATGNAARYGSAEIAEGSSMEIYVTATSPHIGQYHGFHRVFRYPNQAGVDVMGYFECGVIDSTKDSRLAETLEDTCEYLQVDWIICDDEKTFFAYLKIMRT